MIDQSYISFGLDPGTDHPLLSYVITTYAKPPAMLLYALLPVADTPLTEDVREFFDFLKAMEAKLGKDVSHQTYIHSSLPFSWAIEDGILTPEEIISLYDPDLDGLIGDEDPDPARSDADHDGLIDGETLVTSDNRIIEYLKSASASLYPAGLFYKDLGNGVYEFTGEKTLRTDPLLYDSDLDNKGDGFEYYLKSFLINSPFPIG